MPIIAIIALVATIGITRLTGDWIVSGKQIPLGDMTAADIKGWMTLENVSAGLQIPLADLYNLASIPDGSDVPPTTAMKDLEALVEGFETSLLRDAAAAYLAGDAIPAPEATPVPTVAATPTAQPTPPPATPHTPLGAGAGTGAGTGPTPLPPGQVLPYDQIKGKMTLQEVADQCAVPLDRLLAALNLPADIDPGMQAKTLVDEGKVAEIQNIRDVVKALQLY
jgi:hypothetical protein